MQKLRLLLTFLICLSVYTPKTYAALSEHDANILYVESLNHLNNREYKEGITSLEKIFKHTKDAKLKAEVAYLLVITEYDTRKGMRSNYGKYAFKHYTTISHIKRMDLAQLTADLFFEEGELEDAYYFYKAVFTDKKAPFKFKEFSTYKGGWVLVNLERYEEIFEIWSRWLKNNKEGSFRDLIVQDYAKFYYEYHTMHKKKRYPLYTPNIEDKLVYDKFLGGLQAGFKRYKRKSPQDGLDSIVGTPFYTAVLNTVLKESHYLNQKPCKALPYIRKAKLTELNKKDAFKKTDLCFSKFKPYILGKRRGLKKVIRETKSELNQTYRFLEFAGIENLIRGEFFYVTRDYKYACQSFLKALNSYSEKEIKPKKLTKAFNAMGRSCQKIKTKDYHKDLAQFYNTFLSSKKFKQVYLKNSKVNQVFKSITRLPEHIYTMAPHFIRNIKLWKGDSLTENTLKLAFQNPKLLMPMLLSTNLDIINGPHKKLFLSTFHRYIKNKKYKEAEELLSYFAPIPHANVETTKLWLLLSKTKYQKRNSFPNDQQIASHFDHLINKKGTRIENKKFMAYYLVQNNKLNSINNRWKELKSQLYKDKALAEQFATKLLEIDIAKTFPQQVKDDKIIAFTHKYQDILKNGTRSSKKFYVPRPINRTILGRDALQIAKTHNLGIDIRKKQNKAFKDQDLIKYIQKTKSVVDSFGRHRWLKDKAYEISKSNLKNALNEFIKLTNTLKQKPDANAEELDQVIMILNNWKDSV